MSVTLAKFFARDSTWVILFAILMGVIFVVSMVVTIAVSNEGKVRALCDDAVHQVLTTKDPVELRRSMFLVRHLDCSIRRRL